MPNFVSMVPISPSKSKESSQEGKRSASDIRTQLPSASIEEYLEAIFRLLKNGNQYAKTGELAEMLNVAPASVTQMVQKLAEKKYLKYLKGRGVRLTTKGRRLALDVLRRHRIAERLLVDLLGVSWEKAHEVACEWEHLLTPELCNKILARLDDPAKCPHGNPIPNSNGSVEPLPPDSVADLAQDKEAIIDCISDENPELLRMMASMGMLPGEKVRVIQTSPTGDTFLVEVGTAQFALSRALAKRIRIHREVDED
jgi:DtxR family Mn-dependent transcriptional regulator